MKPRISLVLVIGVAILVLGFAAACSSTVAATRSLGKVPPPNPFKVVSLAVNPSEVNAGVAALITAQVTNTQTIDDSYVGEVRIDNVSNPSLPTYTYSDEVNIPAGTTQIVSVSTAISYGGKYKVTWGDSSQYLTVNEDESRPAGAVAPSGPVTAPNFTGTDVVTGKAISLKQFSGTPVLLSLVNYGCDPSLNNVVSAQLKTIKELQAQRSDFAPVSVFCGCCPPEVLRQFARDNGFNWPWILDTGNTITFKYGNYLRKYGYPTLVLIDKDQSINIATGYTKTPALIDLLNKLAAKAQS